MKKDKIIRLTARSCSCCPMIVIEGGYGCKATQRRLTWEEGFYFEQPDWCPLHSGDIIIKQGN